MGLWATIFGAPKAVSDAGEIVKTVTSGVVAGIDKAFYTAEEKAENSQKRLELISNLIIKLQDQFAPRAISRRLIALAFCFVFDAAFLSCVVLAILGKMGVVNSIIEIVSAFMLGEIILTIIFFYFGYYGVTSIVDKFKK